MAHRALCALLTASSRALNSGSAPPLGGTNVIVTSQGVTYQHAARLPHLKAETRMTSYGAMANDAFDGIISVGATLSLDPDNKFYIYGVAALRSLQMFLDMVNYDFGGLNVSGKRYGMRFTWVGDGGSSLQVSNATAHASRLTNADFLFAGYASGYTTHAVKQSYAEGKLIMCGGAAASSVYMQNNLSFGFFPPAGSYTYSSLLAVRHKAAALDESGAQGCGLEGAAASTTCVERIRVGILQADAFFTTSMCSSVPANAAAAGLVVASDAEGEPVSVTVPSSPTDEEMRGALEVLQAVTPAASPHAR